MLWCEQALKLIENYFSPAALKSGEDPDAALLKTHVRSKPLIKNVQIFMFICKNIVEHETH